MSISVKSKYIVLAVIGAICAILALGWYCGSSRAKKALNVTIMAQNATISHYEAVIGGKDQDITEATQIISRQKDALKALGLDNKDLRELNIKQAHELTEAKFRIDTLLTHVNHGGTIITIHDTVKVGNPQKAILLPFGFDKKDQWLSLNGTFDKDGALSIGLKIDATVDVISGYNRKEKINIVSVFSDCPYIKTLAVKSFKTDKEKTKRWSVGFDIGYGYDVGDKSFGGYLGVGLQYSLFRF